MGSFSIFHWMVVIIVLLLVFGPKRFADAAKGLGQALRGFKEELGKGADEESHQASDDAAKRLPGHEPGAPSGTSETASKTASKTASETASKTESSEGHDERPV